jgi:hypothetical protein
VIDYTHVCRRAPFHLKYSARRFSRNIRNSGKKERTERKSSGDERATQEMTVIRSPGREKLWTLAQACREEPVRRQPSPAPGGLRCSPLVLSGARTMAAAGSGEDPQGQSPRSAHARSTRLSRAGLFIPPREPPTVRRHILVRSFQEEKPQLRRRQRPVMRGARPPFHGTITARSGVNSRSLSCQENSAQDRSVAPAAEYAALESLAFLHDA